MVNLNLDTALRTGTFKVYMAIFGNYAPKLFNIDNPRQTLALSLIPSKRKTQTRDYLNGINPVGLVSTVELHKHYARGVRVDKINLDTFEAISHILSRILSISPEETEQIITDKFTKGFKEITFITMLNSMNSESGIGDKWLVYAELPDENTRLDGLNKLLKAKNSTYRALTKKTYAMKVYGE